ncbi:phosphoribosyltransferase [Marinobacter halodurans]|uniref:phosphoribosyltransferase n=1 Tax=Marinobacter halodurans TaxID=2528979 RepID=UPI001F603CC4|nr:phosphoribosyltransferase family protein [Marinobacter halodurans]
MLKTLFKDREAAGAELARTLKTHSVPADALVLGLPRGGVPVAREIAQALGLELDVLNLRKLGLPRQPEVAMGAIAEDGTRYLDHRLIRAVGVTAEELERVQQRELDTLASRIRRFRLVRKPAPVAGRTVILVDDGVATGATMELAVQVLRKREARRIIVAVPVGPLGTTARFSSIADDCVCLLEPKIFNSVGLWYSDFQQVSEEEVIEALEEAQRLALNRSKTS